MSGNVKGQAFKIIISVLSFVALLAIGGYFLLPLEAAGVILWMILAVAGLVLLVRWHAGAVGYRCLNCGEKARFSPFKELFLSDKGKKEDGGIKCPSCGHKIKTSRDTGKKR